jgi:hypothetical protein
VWVHCNDVDTDLTISGHVKPEELIIKQEKVIVEQDKKMRQAINILE